MKIATFGAKHALGQLPRIEEGLKTLGVEITDEENADVIYYNNAPYNLHKTNKFKIFNVLDIPVHLVNAGQFDLKPLFEQLKTADIVTCISYAVKMQLKRYFDIDATVIYNPIKDVFHTNSPRTIFAAYIGRSCDPNKRFHLVKEALSYFDNGESLLVTCGENPGFGRHLGVVSDEDLNKVYNQSQFIFLPSRLEGLGLSMIESLCCGCIPILTYDNPCSHEFAPADFITYPDGKSIAELIYKIHQNYSYYSELSLRFGKKYAKQFHKEKIANNILDLIYD